MSDRPNPSQAGWWAGLAQGVRELANVGKRYVVPDDVATSPDLPRLKDGDKSAAPQVDAELVGEEPCPVTSGCSRRAGHDGPCVLPAKGSAT